MVGLLKQFWILRFNYLVVIRLPLEYKKSYKSLVGAPIGFNITQNGLKMKKIWHLNLEKA
jgi:hypothetical protein